MKYITIISRSLLLVVLSLALAACATTASTNTLPASTIPDAVKSKVLVLTLRGTTAETIVGAIDVTIETPAGVSVKAQENGLIEGGIITTPPTATRPFLTGKFSNKMLRVAMISPTEIKGGEIMQIKLNVTTREALRAESFQVKSLQVVDLKGKNVNGVSVAIDVR